MNRIKLWWLRWLRRGKEAVYETDSGLLIPGPAELRSSDTYEMMGKLTIEQTTGRKFNIVKIHTIDKNKWHQWTNTHVDGYTVIPDSRGGSWNSFRKTPDVEPLFEDTREFDVHPKAENTDHYIQ